MTIQEMIDKLNKIAESNKEGTSLRLYSPDMKPIKKVRVIVLAQDKKFVLVSDK